MFKAVKNVNRLWLGLKTVEVDVNQSKIIYFYGNCIEKRQVYELAQAKDILKHPKFKLSQKTLFYIHGYEESVTNSKSIETIINSYIRRKDHNILVLDWHALASGNYLIDAVPNVKILGPKLADILLRLMEAGLPCNMIHLVGHSLGGQLAGMIGRNVVKISKKTIILPRISALDPAFPPFFPIIGITPINEDDAAMVDVIHTDSWLYGTPFRTGTVDFYPNGGKSLQPGCPKRTHKVLDETDLCSHHRSWKYWAESVAAGDSVNFLAVKANDWNDFVKGFYDEKSFVQMGYNCPDNVKGKYYLQTNGEYPYSKGKDGTKYVMA